MDEELEERTESRKFDTTAENDVTTNDYTQNDQRIDNEAAQDIHVLNNLLQSLEASGGGSGPVTNMLKEMDDSNR